MKKVLKIEFSRQNGKIRIFIFAILDEKIDFWRQNSKILVHFGYDFQGIIELIKS